MSDPPAGEKADRTNAKSQDTLHATIGQNNPTRKQHRLLKKFGWTRDSKKQIGESEVSDVSGVLTTAVLPSRAKQGAQETLSDLTEAGPDVQGFS